MKLTVLTWNIQNYGPTKQKYSDIVKAIATTVVNEQADIFVLLEGNTNNLVKAKGLADTMQRALQTASAGKFKICVLSPITGVEFYAFFYRDENVTKPYTTPINTPNIGVDLNKVKFESGRPSAIQQSGAPLLKPDIAAYSDRNIQKWPGSRYPSFSLFRFNGAFVGIFACHYAAAKTLAEHQIRALPTFSVLAGLAPPIPASRAGSTPSASKVGVPATVTVDGNPVSVQCVIVTGDFNIDYATEQKAYAPLEGRARVNAKRMQIGATAYNTIYNTILITPRKFSPRMQKSTSELAHSNIDNHFVALSRNAGFAANQSDCGVLDIANEIRLRSIQLSESVTHYAELDQRGFEAGAYLPALRDYESQLNGDKSHHINLPGSLIGARLISDHLPVVMEVDIN